MVTMAVGRLGLRGEGGRMVTMAVGRLGLRVVGGRMVTMAVGRLGLRVVGGRMVTMAVGRLGLSHAQVVEYLWYYCSFRFQEIAGPLESSLQLPLLPGNGVKGVGHHCL